MYWFKFWIFFFFCFRNSFYSISFFSQRQRNNSNYFARFSFPKSIFFYIILGSLKIALAKSVFLIKFKMWRSSNFRCYQISKIEFFFILLREIKKVGKLKETRVVVSPQTAASNLSYISTLEVGTQEDPQRGDTLIPAAFLKISWWSLALCWIPQNRFMNSLMIFKFLIMIY